MKKYIYILGLSLVILSGCGPTKKLETMAPFSLGETYAQKWSVGEPMEEDGYELVVSVLSLDNDNADLKNIYYNGKMAPISIEVTDKGIIGISEFGKVQSSEEFPFELTETQAVISYMQKDKVKYYQINGIQQNLPISYSNLDEKNSR
ncbi:hypothetical protein ZORO111903_04095 [Zobellia roscoffensis]|uniref:hypothetical protein n=1 Tax=Zobellia roscoffensis TaxID=2779508 RepID=UPI00188CA179|nr:hypothetical protein [Zobellia roscoffensis]